MVHRDCHSSQEGAAESVASDEWPRSTTPPRRGWQSLHWSGVVKSYLIVVEVISSSNVNVGGARRSHYLRGCVSVCLVIRPHAYLYLFFLSFWQLNARVFIKKILCARNAYNNNLRMSV